MHSFFYICLTRRLGLDFFYFILNLLPLIRDVTCSRLYLDGKNMEEKMSEEHSQMVCDAEDSTVQASKDREIELISRKVSRKRKVILKRKLSDTQCERNINTIAGELVSSGNIAS